jgi:hypothetical protein
LTKIHEFLFRFFALIQMLAQYHFHIKLSILMLLKVFLFKKEQHNDINVELIKDHSSTIPMDASTNYQVPINKQHGTVQTSE